LYGAATVNSNEFEKKIAMAACMNIKGVMEDRSGWKPTTKKRGPKKRLSKKRRRAKIKLRKL